MTRFSFTATTSARALSMGVFCLTHAALAEDAGKSQPAEPALEEIVVTGSRIARRDFTSSSPIVTVDTQQIKDSGRVNLEDVLGQMPQFVPAQTSSSVLLGGGGRATVNLRGLGEQRGLVLLDGHRLPLSGSDGLVDINVLPSGIVGGVEVVTGGASSVYGSDAISGVVNFKTVTHQDGFKFDGQYGQSSQNDAKNSQVSLSYGTDYAGGDGDLLVAGSYNKRDEVVGDQRDFFVKGGTASGFLSSGVYFPAGNPVNQAALNTTFASYGVGPVANTGTFSFNNDGTLFARAGGVNFRGDTDRFQVVGGSLSEKISRDATQITPQDRYSFYAKTKYNISSDLNVFGSGLFTSSKVKMATGFMSTQPLSLIVPVNNVFLANSPLGPLLATRPNPTAPIVFNDRFMQVGKRYYTDKYQTYQLFGGIGGKLPIQDWTWETTVSYDRTSVHETLVNAVRDDRAQALVGAADGGASLCQGGWNPFGLNNSLSISQSCRDYMAGPVRNATSVSQVIAEGTLQGGLFAMPAGEARFALSADYHRTRYATTADKDLQVVPGTTRSNIEATPPTTPTSGATSVKEVSAELFVPILADFPGIKALNADAGYRFSDYNLSGGTHTYKADLEWRPYQDLLVRGGAAHAIRAPNVGELFSQATLVAQVGNPPTQGDPCDQAFAARAAHLAQFAAICNAQAGGAFPGFATFGAPSSALGQARNGNKNLKPEVGDTVTFGAVWQPEFTSTLLNRPSLSVDYYDIRLKKAISFLSGANVINSCFNVDGSNPTYDPNNVNCGLIVRDPSTGAVSIINTPYLNLGEIKTSGIDVQLDLTAQLGSVGKLQFNVAYNHLLSYDVQNITGGRVLSFKGTVNAGGQATPALPNDKWLTTATYTFDRYSLGARWQHYGGMKDISSVTSATPLRGVAAYNLFDLFARAGIGHGIELRAGVNNLLDKEPPQVSSSGGQTQTNAQLYDIVGRSFYMGVTARF